MYEKLINPISYAAYLEEAEINWQLFEYFVSYSVNTCTVFIISCDTS